MAEKYTPTTDQEKVISLLAQGMSKNKAASIGGVARSSVTRWVKEKDFMEEIEKRKAMLAAAKRISEVQQLTKDAAAKRAIAIADGEKEPDLIDLVKELRDSKRNRRKLWRSIGNNLISKMVGRIRDLPSEAFSTQVADRYLKLGIEMILNTEEELAEELALNELLEHMLETKEAE